MAKLIKKKESRIDDTKLFQEKRSFNVETTDYIALREMLDEVEGDSIPVLVNNPTVSSVTGVAKKKKKNKKKATVLEANTSKTEEANTSKTEEANISTTEVDSSTIEANPPVAEVKEEMVSELEALLN